MIDSKYEMLEGRVTALEAAIAKAPAEGPVDPDARTERISDIIREQMIGMDAITFTQLEKLKRGIRKAMNEFYQGPKTSNDQSARLNALLDEKETLMQANAKLQERERELEDEIVRLDGAPSVGFFTVGDQVIKPEGYPFPGEVRAAFTNRKGEVRYAVEATIDPYAGMIHIYNEKQLAEDPEVVARLEGKEYNNS